MRRRGIAPALLFACAAGLAAGALPGVEGAPRGALPALPSQSPEDLGPGRFLVASRGVFGPIFAESVVLLLEHGAEGTMGLIVNRPTESRLGEILPDFEALLERPDRAWFGGPVGFGTAFLLLVRAEEPAPGGFPVVEGVYATGEPDTLKTLLAAGDTAFRGYVGYAGWAPHQLEGEMARGDWYVLPADAATTFSEHPERVWSRLIESCEGVEARVSRPPLP